LTFVEIHKEFSATEHPKQWLIKHNLFQDPTEKQLEHQSDQLGELQQQGKELEAELQQLSEVIMILCCR